MTDVLTARRHERDNSQHMLFFTFLEAAAAVHHQGSAGREAHASPRPHGQRSKGFAGLEAELRRRFHVGTRGGAPAKFEARISVLFSLIKSNLSNLRDQT